MTKKTNAVRLCDQAKLGYSLHEYETNGQLDGMQVAECLHEPYEKVFKTLVVTNQKDLFVFMVPVADHLNLKWAAKVAGEKKLEMLAQKELLGKVGYVHGGCSPIGMKKKFPTFLHHSAQAQEEIYFSAGQIGLQMKMKVSDLAKIVPFKWY